MHTQKPDFLGFIDGKEFLIGHFKWAFRNDYDLFLEMKRQNPNLFDCYDILWRTKSEKVPFSI